MARPEQLLSEESIDERVRELAADVVAAAGTDLHLLVVLRGAFVFAADLARRLSDEGAEVTIDFCRVVSYRDGTEAGPVELEGLRVESLAGKDVLIVEDIMDTGGAARALLEAIPPDLPRSLRTAALLDKPARRRHDLTPDFVGFVIPDCFVVGYGLDFAGRHRHLPYVGRLDGGPDGVSRT